MKLHGKYVRVGLFSGGMSLHCTMLKNKVLKAILYFNRPVLWMKFKVSSSILLLTVVLTDENWKTKS